MTSSMTVYRALALALADSGTQVIFGLLGDGNLALMDEVVNRHGLSYIPVNREDSAVAAADAYARVSGKLGVATVTHGPGLTNAITALHEAARAGTPLIVLCGDTDPRDLTHNQDIDQRSTVAPTGAGFVQLRSAETIIDDLARAVRMARQEQRPVVFNLPVNLQTEETSYRKPSIEALSEGAPGPDPAVLDEALGIIATAKRPVVLAGSGAIRADARTQLLRLADLLQAPVATTLKAMGLFADEPFNLGVCGSVSSPLAAETLSKADCLVAFGASLNRYTTMYGSLLERKTVIHVDVDPGAIGRWYPVDSEVVGDAATVAGLMADALSSLGDRPSGGLASAHLAQRLAGYDPAHDFQDISTSEYIDPRTLMIWLDRTVPEDRILVWDVGGFMEIPLRYLGVADPRAHVLPAAFGSVGLAMGAAVGAGIADPQRPVLVVMGDGGWMMGGVNCFDTAVRQGIDMIAVVLNDGGYGIERRALEARGSEASMASMDWPDPSRAARALGGDAITIECLDDLDPARRSIEERTRPLLLDTRIPR